MRLIIVLLILILSVWETKSQITPQNTKNFQVNITPRKAVKTIEELRRLPIQQQGATITYFDGIGRVEQTIQIGAIASTSGYRSLVTPHTYDSQGRESRQFLPYSIATGVAEGAYRANAVTEQASFYQSMYPNQAAYSDTRFDGSPFNRPIAHSLVGNPLDQTSVPNPSIKDYAQYTVGVNSASQIALWRIEDNGQPTPSGYYQEGTLYKTRVTNADGRTTESFVDLQGRTICTIADPNGEKAVTQYLYDEFGQLRWVFPPAFNNNKEVKDLSGNVVSINAPTELTGISNASFVLMNNASVTLKPNFVGTPGFSVSSLGFNQAQLDAYCFYYEYDNDGRLAKKKAPGIAPIYYAYDGRDRLVAVQDGNQRKLGRWAYYRYDELNRNIESGLLTNGVTDQVTMQTKIDVAYKSVGYTWFDKENGSDYTSTSYPKPTTDGTLTPLSYIWYDYYPTGAPAFDRAKAYTDSSSMVLGRITQVKVRTIDDIPAQTAIWSTKAIYYDADGQAIQGVSNGSILGTTAKITVSSKLGWRGQLQEVKEVQTFGTITTSMLRAYSYYDNGVLRSLAASYNGVAPTTLASYTYDDLGRVKEKLVGNASQSQRYTYNIRGWLTQINDPNSAIGNDLFALKLAYETPEAGTTAAAQYAGNISSATWQSRSSATVAAPKKTYGYSYDALNRLTSADFVGGANANSSEEKGIAYDLNGNILSLTRTDANGTASSYSYAYNGNQLSAVTMGGKTGAYTYDDNGNMVTDGRKGMNFGYNPLNMISTVTSGTSVLRNLYDATGARLATVNPDGSATYYHGSMVYTKPSSGSVALKYTMHDEGMVMGNGTFQYLLKDNQGNTRIAYTNVAGQVQVVQSTDYYPYGMPHGIMNADKNPYLYTGKELQNQQVGAQPLNLMDYGARYYDYELARWHGIDPLAEIFFQVSCYSFCGDNPITSIDSNGMDHRPWYWDKTYHGDWTEAKERIWSQRYEYEAEGSGSGSSQELLSAEYTRFMGYTGGRGNWMEALNKGYCWVTDVNCSGEYYRYDNQAVLDPAIVSSSKVYLNPSYSGDSWRQNFVDVIGNLSDLAEAGSRASRYDNGLNIVKIANPLINIFKVGLAIEKDNYSIGRNTLVQTSKIGGGLLAGIGGVTVGAWIGGAIGGGIGFLCGGFGSIPGVYIGQAIGGAIGGYFAVSYSSDLIDVVANKTR